MAKRGKKVVRCLGGCGNITRLYGSFSVTVFEQTKNLLTGQISTQELEGQICRNCARVAGYKVKYLKDGSEMKNPDSAGDK